MRSLKKLNAAAGTAFTRWEQANGGAGRYTRPWSPILVRGHELLKEKPKA